VVQPPGGRQASIESKNEKLELAGSVSRVGPLRSMPCSFALGGSRPPVCAGQALAWPRAWRRGHVRTGALADFGSLLISTPCLSYKCRRDGSID